MKMNDLKGKAMWLTTMELNDKVSQVCSNLQASTLLVKRDVKHMPTLRVKQASNGR